ncbi:MAG: hypothetical protein ACRYG4_26195 [Janthinobacterium lividum]
MRPELQEAAERLAAVLDAENAALRDLDFRRLGSFVDEKRIALSVLTASPSAPADQATTIEDPVREALGIRLRRLTEENRGLLERAIIVQNRIMAVLASAARQAQAPVGYGAKGHRPRQATSSAVALIVRV